MSQSSWEADKMLDVYIYDYLVKRKLHASAKAFMTEAKVATDPVAIDAPGGFLYEWWSVFWDVFISRTNAKHSEPAAAYIEVQQMKAKEQQKMAMQQRNIQLQRGNPNLSSNAGSAINIQPDGIMGQPSSSMLAMKYDGMRTPIAMEQETSDPNRMAFPRSTSEHQGQLLHGNSGNMSALQQTPSRIHLAAEARSESMGAGQKSMASDPSMYGQGIIQSKSGGPGAAGLNQGPSGIPLKGWPLTTPSLGLQKPNMQTQSQFLLASQQQQALSQGNHGNLGNSSQYSEVDPRRFGGLPRSGLLAKDGQSARNDGAISSSGQANSAKMKMGQMQQSSSQSQDQLLQQQQQQQQKSQQNTRKRRQPSSSGPANSTGTGNTTGPSPASPQSTHTAGPGDGITAASSMHRTPQTNIYPEGSGILVSSSNLLDDLDHFGDLASLDENVESFLSDADGTNFYGTLKQNPTGTRKEGSKGPEFPLGEVGCIRKGNSKVTCCHFSSDGKFLASAGHDKKVVFWNMDTLETHTTSEEHDSVVTDVRFRPNSTHVVTTSVDKSVRLWDAANPSFCLRAYTTHTSPIMSLDFHPVKTDLFCFCDNDNEIRYLDVNSFNFTRSHKGGAAQVRFQPRAGKFLAAASDKVVSIFDVETDRQLHSFQGHPDLVNYICWDPLGDYLASVSQNLVKVWSLANGQCVQEHVSTNMNQFHSCVFHPGYTAVLVIGGVSCLDMWNCAENKSVLIPAHENIVSALSHTPVSNLVASASHDSSVKIWK